MLRSAEYGAPGLRAKKALVSTLHRRHETELRNLEALSQPSYRVSASQAIQRSNHAVALTGIGAWGLRVHGVDIRTNAAASFRLRAQRRQKQGNNGRGGLLIFYTEGSCGPFSKIEWL